ncbi:MAG: hypothetical protein KC776_05270 [Myxococcales bacterium]|nr:hypothetical protein [Myxococcales bacterium]MCB9575577.1 hypothetical protein [Polyangiaceae bacterium]
MPTVLFARPTRASAHVVGPKPDSIAGWEPRLLGRLVPCLHIDAKSVGGNAADLVFFFTEVERLEFDATTSGLRGRTEKALLRFYPEGKTLRAKPKWQCRAVELVTVEVPRSS